MTSRVPTVRPFAWLSAIPHVAMGAALIATAHFAFRPPELGYSFVFGSLAYLALSRGLGAAFASHQRRGTAHLLAGRFAEAIPHFERSYAFFACHPWLDRWRYLTLLSSSAVSFREMALCNIAFAYGQLNDGAKAIEHYQRALAEFPDSAFASVSLKMMQAAQSARRTTQPT